MLTALPLFTMLALSPSHIIIIAILVLVFFGGKKIPEMMRGMGQGVKEFKDAMNKDYTAENEKKENDNKQIENKQVEK